MNNTLFNNIKPVYDYKEMIDLALATWYPKNHPLHLDPLHPSMGLVGEIGEWVNKRKKDLFKAEYEFTREDTINEVGDKWYYQRILTYQTNIETANYAFKKTSTHIIVANMALCAANIWLCAETGKPFKRYLKKHQIWLNTYLEQLEITLDELTALNWEKLKPGSTRGDEWTSSWEKQC